MSNITLLVVLVLINGCTKLSISNGSYFEKLQYIKDNLSLSVKKILELGYDPSVNVNLDKNIKYNGTVDSITAESYTSFRITFGLKDTIPTSWDGEIINKKGQQIELEVDRFRNTQYDKTIWTSEGFKRIRMMGPVQKSDYLRNETSWVCSTRESILHGQTTEWHVIESSMKPIIQNPSILVHIKNSSLSNVVEIKTVGGNFSINIQDIINDSNRYFLEGKIKVEHIPFVQNVSENENEQQDFPSIISARSGKLWVAWQEYDNVDKDKVLARYKYKGVWSPMTVLVENADVFQTAIGEDSNNHIWVVWSEQLDNRWDIWGCSYDGKKWSNRKRITVGEAGKNFHHKLVTDSKGLMWLVWQSTIQGRSQIYVKNFDGTRWSADKQVSEGKSAKGNNWWPSIATGRDNSVVVTWDGYALGSYDVYMRRWHENEWEDEIIVAGTEKFEAHSSVAIDNENRVWIAWDESGENWGKDRGYLFQNREATQLHESRTIRIACFDGKEWLTTTGGIEEVFQPDEFWELPHLQIDEDGMPVIFARHMVMRQPDTPLEGPINLALWEIHMTRYNGSSWTEPLCLPRSTGRNDIMPASAIDKNNNIWTVWATDLRNPRSHQSNQNLVQVSKININKKGRSLTSLKLYSPTKTQASQDIALKREIGHIQNIHEYKIQSLNKSYSIYRGDLHRHTDISNDGYNDGSLLDAYRYSRDVAALDFIGISDHNDNVWDNYNWWRSQKIADLFQNRNSFVSFYGYERSVEFPNGHRNIFFIKRGVDIFPKNNFELRGNEGSERLYWYIKRNNGFSIPHTTGRTSGTDWRENNKEVESLVEIYQGMRDSYEYPNSPRPFKLFSRPDTTNLIPRASSDPKSSSFRHEGFVNKALEKGLKLGFIASSDHISTHISYACLIAEELTPESLLEAIRERRAYAATDNIILDVKFKSSGGEHLMGEVFKSKSPILVKIKIIGTDEIQQIDLIKNGEIVFSSNPNQIMYDGEFEDVGINYNKENYYYLRVFQKNGEMAWGSPVWVTYE